MKISSALSQATGVQIYQIYYKEDQLPFLDPAFVGFDNVGVADERLEFGVFERLARSPKTRALNAWGAVSWRFGQKTGLSGQALLDVVDTHPDADVFFMNSLPINEALFDSGWMQGEISHPGLIELAQAVLEASGHESSLVYQPEHSSVYSTANYFVGRSKFWKAYIPFIRSILKAADKKLTVEMKCRLHQNADPKGVHYGATFVPFLVERLFPLFLQTAGQNLRAHRVFLPAKEAELNAHLKLLRSLKDQAIKERSEWLMTVWRNYRNLYFQQMAAKQWSDKHVPMMNLSDWHVAFTGQGGLGPVRLV
jgi:hypothetical protein